MEPEFSDISNFTWIFIKPHKHRTKYSSLAGPEQVEAQTGIKTNQIKVEICEDVCILLEDKHITQSVFM